MADLVMYDSVDLGQVPADAQAVAGYVGGRWPTAAQIPGRFPRARLLTIAVSAGEDADCLDIETGDATPGDAAGWYGRQKARGVTRPCLYASAGLMESGVVPAIRAAGIARPAVRLWSAHYTGSAHICGPGSCGLMSVPADGTQWTDRALGRDLDASVLAANFFAPLAAAARPATAGPRPWVTAGMDSLRGLAAAHGTRPCTVLRLTAEHSPHGQYPAGVAAWLDAVFAGEADPSGHVPAGLRLWLPR